MNDCHESLYCPVKKEPCPELAEAPFPGCPLADRCALLALVEVERARLCVRCKTRCDRAERNANRGQKAEKRLANCPDVAAKVEVR